MYVAVVTPPASVSAALLPLVKAQLRIDHDDANTLLETLIDAAIGWLDGPNGWLGRCLLPQTLELRMDSFYEGDWQYGGRCIWDQACGWDWGSWPFPSQIGLPYPPFVSVTSITYEDSSGVDQTLSSSGWRADAEGELDAGWQLPWPTGRIEADAVRIRYVAGYPLTTNSTPKPTFPAPVMMGVLMLVSHLYYHPDAVVGVENRDSSTELPLGAMRFLHASQDLDVMAIDDGNAEMAWVRFTADFDYQPSPVATIGYKSGMELSVRRECAELAISTGAAVEVATPPRPDAGEVMTSQLLDALDARAAAIATAVPITPDPEQPGGV